MIKIIISIIYILLVTTTILAYSCDPSNCNSADCRCASKTPPGGISPENAPQFVIISFDDAVNANTFEITEKMYRGLANSNGCPVVATHFVQNIYTNYHLVQQLYGKGDEIALHTFNHVPLASLQEIKNGRTVLTTLAGIPESDIKGFRAPFLNYTDELISNVQSLGLMYDSSAPTIVEDSHWPYTLNNGFSDSIDCLTTNTCGSIKPHNGLWEIELYSTFYDNNSPPISMDPDYDNGNLLEVLKKNFNFRYNGNRQPMALALHAVHVNTPVEKLNLYREFIKWTLSFENVYYVTYSQLIEYMKNPVEASQLNDIDSVIGCKKLNTYIFKGSNEFCDGIDNNGDGNIDEGLVENCGIGNSYFSTCFGCPTSEPTVDNPNPQRNGNRQVIPPGGCGAGTWDPIEGKCQGVDNSGYINEIAKEKIDNGSDGNGKSSSSANSKMTFNFLFLLGNVLIISLINFIIY